MTRRLLEHEVSCEWCGAKEGEYCVDLKGNRYYDEVHIDRVRLYDFNNKTLVMTKG